MLILSNNTLVEEHLLALPPLAEGFLFGTGVFSTLRVREGQPCWAELHEERLVRDSSAVGATPFPATSPLGTRCAACARANALSDGALKVVWFKASDGTTSELIFPRPLSFGPEKSASGLHLRTTTCEDRSLRTLMRHKSLNYAEHLQAKRAALAAGCDDTLWIDAHGRILECATMNLFLVQRDGALLTPPPALGLLPGVMRRIVLERLARSHAEERVVTRDDLATAAEVFTTNALIGVLPVTRIDTLSFPLGPTTAHLADQVRAAEPFGAASHNS